MTRSLHRFLAPLLLAGLAAGCNSTGQAPPPSGHAGTVSAPAAQPAPARKSAKAKVEPPPPRPAARAPVDTAAAPPLPPSLIGLSEDQTAALLGRPSEEAEEAPGKVWTYAGNACRLTVHLFPDMQKGGFYALDYSADDAPKEQCVARLAEAKRRG
jgi:hypothetical protein